VTALEKPLVKQKFEECETFTFSADEEIISWTPYEGKKPMVSGFKMTTHRAAGGRTWNTKPSDKKGGYLIENGNLGTVTLDGPFLGFYGYKDDFTVARLGIITACKCDREKLIPPSLAGISAKFPDSAH